MARSINNILSHLRLASHLMSPWGAPARSGRGPGAGVAALCAAAALAASAGFALAEAPAKAPAPLPSPRAPVTPEEAAAAPWLARGASVARGPAGAPAAAPSPTLRQAGAADSAVAAPSDPAAAASEADRMTLGGFSIAPSAPRAADGPVAAAIRRAFAGRRLADPAGPESPTPLKPRSGRVGFVLVDPKTGRVLERRNPDVRMIPASVAKAPTALYALDVLGPAHRFETRLAAVGPIAGGVLRGDLYLIGGGDPVLDGADLTALVERLKDAGVTRVAGRFFYDAHAYPAMAALEPSQPPQAAYNPALSGLNLNFNRVRLNWERGKGGRYTFTATASGAKKRVPTPLVSAVAVGSGATSGFERVERPWLVGPGVVEGVREEWRIARRLLSKRGGRWLPTRRPGAYAASIFQALAHQEGVGVPAPRPAQAPQSARTLARFESRPLEDIVRGMLKHSTNLTAEAVGLAASRARGLPRLDVDRSAGLMSSWADTRFGVLGSTEAVAAAPTEFHNHSGLSTDSRLTARAMAAILMEAARDGARFDAFLDVMPLYRWRGKPKGLTVKAKTGTVYYGRGLAGYMECASGRRLAFAYLHSDIPGRAKFDAAYDPASGGRPAGASAWLGRARSIERKLLAAWHKRHC